MNPNLRPCPSCQKEIAQDAQICPHCGKRFTTAFTMWLAILIGLFFLVVWLLSVKG